MYQLQLGPVVLVPSPYKSSDTCESCFNEFHTFPDVNPLTFQNETIYATVFKDVAALALTMCQKNSGALNLLKAN